MACPPFDACYPDQNGGHGAKTRLCPPDGPHSSSANRNAGLALRVDQKEDGGNPMKSASLWMSSLTLAAAGGWFAATLFAPAATGKQPRFPQLTMDQLDEKQKPLGEQVMKV